MCRQQHAIEHGAHAVTATRKYADWIFLAPASAASAAAAQTCLMRSCRCSLCVHAAVTFAIGVSGRIAPIALFLIFALTVAFLELIADRPVRLDVADQLGMDA